ncbi:MAG: hypothetical protein CVV44_06330 [Spirochaetae bacterium HGW-Spirochaetae-1]|jgi:anti-sigma regulatory factor (Ser/Thr protein kinase)|nr:MAG: hypothetical protein CVV44_06330 [Spirochaetae bacterium HGW-Spirochaetae-1]
MLNNQNTNIYQNQFPSSKHSKKNIVDAVTNFIKHEKIGLRIRYEELYLALDEAITNAMEHGNKWSSSKNVHISISVDRSHLVIIVTDDGKGFNYNELKMTLSEENRFKRRGRGLFIINQFCHIEWNEKGNQIIMNFELSS